MSDRPSSTRVPAAEPALALSSSQALHRGACHPLLLMQAAAGNAATSAWVAQASVQRLMTGQYFRERVGAGKLTSSKILPTIAGLLDELRPIHGRAETDLSLFELTQALPKAELVAEDCRIWLDKHSMATGDTEVERANVLTTLEYDAGRLASKLRAEVAKRTKVSPDAIPGGAEAKNSVRVKEKRKAESMTSFFDHFGKLIDVAVPSNGVKAELEIEVDFPVDNSGVGFIGLRFKAEADRGEATKIKVRTEAAITGGAKIPGLARIKAEFGGYIESQGQTSTEAVRLFSYGLYRLFRESPVMPEGLTNALWGSGATGGVGYKKAETWAANVELGVLKGNKDAYVEAGVLVGAGAEIGGPLAKGKVAVATGGGSRYDAAGIEAIAKSKGVYDANKLKRIATAIAAAKPTSSLAAWRLSNELAEGTDKDLVPGKLIDSTAKKYLKAHPEVKKGAWDAQAIQVILGDKAYKAARTGLGEVIPRGREHSKGESTFWIKGMGEASFGPGVAGLKLESNWITRGRDRRTATHFREAKFELKAGLKVPLNQLVSVGYGAALGLASGSSAASETLRALLTKQEKEAKSNKVARHGGTGASIGASFAPLIANIADVPAKKMSEGLAASPWSKVADKGGMELLLNTTILLTLEGKLKPPTPQQKVNGELNISFSEEKSLMFASAVQAATADFARIAAKQTTRLLRGQYKSDGAWQFDVMGDVESGNIKTDKKEKKEKKEKAKADLDLSVGTASPDAK